MNQKVLAKLCLLLALTLLVTSYFPQPASAVTTTVTVFSTSSDGYITTTGPSYADAWGSVSGTVYDSASAIVGGQYAIPPYNIYSIYRGFLFFDTSSIPAGATIDSAILRLYVTSYTGSGYSLQIQTGGSTYPHDPLQTTDYYQARYSGNGGSADVSTISEGSYWNITLNGYGLSYVTVAGTTKLALRSSNDINYVEAGDSEYITFYSRNYGVAYAPQLVVTYTVASPTAAPSTAPTVTPTPIPGLPTPTPTAIPVGPTNYIIHGPYYEDGSVADATVVASIYQPYAASLENVFNGTDGVADDWSVALDQPANYMKWNITGDYNYTRLYYFVNENFDEIWLYIPSPDSIVQQYSINTILLGQLTNAYVSVLENIDGVNYVIERQPADAINALPFWLCMYNQYSLQISSDEGTWTFNLPADSIQTKTYTITADMVAQSSTLLTFTISATRNESVITFVYSDPSEETIYVTTRIQHYYMGALVTDYEQTDYDNTQSFLMINATSTTSYIANVTAVRNSDTLYWQLDIPADNADLVWSSVFDDLGSWPIPAYQLPAIGLCLLFFGIGNWRDSEAVCLIAIIICGFLQVIGWASFPAPGIAMAGMIVVFAYLHKGKVESVAIES